MQYLVGPNDSGLSTPAAAAATLLSPTSWRRLIKGRIRRNGGRCRWRWWLHTTQRDASGASVLRGSRTSHVSETASVRHHSSRGLALACLSSIISIFPPPPPLSSLYHRRRWWHPCFKPSRLQAVIHLRIFARLWKASKLPPRCC